MNVLTMYAWILSKITDWLHSVVIHSSLEVENVLTKPTHMGLIRNQLYYNGFSRQEFWNLNICNFSFCPARAPPPRVPILSFWHTKFLKHNRLGSPHPLLRGPRPPYGKSWIRHWFKSKAKSYVVSIHETGEITAV